MNRRFLIDTMGWGFVIWFIGYVLGIVLFIAIPSSLIGGVIMPIGIIITLWVLLRRIKSNEIKYYLKISVVWTFIAIVFDHIFLVKLFNPADGYYKLDVYLYYTLTFLLPLLIGLRRHSSKQR